MAKPDKISVNVNFEIGNINSISWEVKANILRHYQIFVLFLVELSKTNSSTTTQFTKDSPKAPINLQSNLQEVQASTACLNVNDLPAPILPSFSSSFTTTTPTGNAFTSTLGKQKKLAVHPQTDSNNVTYMTSKGTTLLPSLLQQHTTGQINPAYTLYAATSLG